MKITKSKLREIIREVISETEAEGYDDPAYRATIEQFKGKQVSKEKFAQALAMHHDSMKNEEILKEVELPAEVKRFANKFIDSLGRANLNKMKQTLVLTMIVDALGIEPKSLAQYMGRVKREL